MLQVRVRLDVKLPGYNHAPGSREKKSFITVRMEGLLQ